MAYIELDNGIKIGEGYKPYIVAEVNSSHFGDKEVAFQMIDAARACGCDCVKFQSWSAESLYSKEYYKSNPIAARIVKKFSLDENSLLDCYYHCRDLGIGFSSTPYSKSEVDFLCDRVESAFIKIASMEVDNPKYLEYIAKKHKAIVLSTGMSDIDEIKRAVDTIVNAGNSRICILHCVSSYPAEDEAVNLRNICLLRDSFPDFPVGYSDHSIGHEIAGAAISLGASFIEKHFTLDRSRIGMDNNMATEPEEMKRLVEGVNSVYKAMGSYERKVSEDELKQRLNMRRSIVTVKDLKSGDVITEDAIGFKRPGTGISPAQYQSIIGKKVRRDIEADYVIYPDDIAD